MRQAARLRLVELQDSIAGGWLGSRYSKTFLAFRASNFLASQLAFQLQRHLAPRAFQSKLTRHRDAFLGFNKRHYKCRERIC